MAAPLSEWFRVSFDDHEVTLDVAPPGQDPWRQSFAWSSVIRVCFKPEPWAADGIYVFTEERPESYAIPMEAAGGVALWNEILGRGLFSAEMAIEAASAIDGLFCWPTGAATGLAGGSLSPSEEEIKAFARQRDEAIAASSFKEADLAAWLTAKLPDREHCEDPEALSEVLGEVLMGGIRALEDLDSILEATRDVLARYEAEQNVRLNDVGVVRVSVRIFDFRFYEASESVLYWTNARLHAFYEESYGEYCRLVKRRVSAGGRVEDGG